jgi:uncharacterized integral membrane protein (TIGR00698 family)
MATEASELVPFSRVGLGTLVPGLIVVVLVSVTAALVGILEARVIGRAIIEPLVLAIVIGMIIRTIRGAAAATEPGVRFAAKEVLEVAVFLLGATMDVPRLFASGPALALGIVALVCGALACGYAIGRLSGLSRNLAVLVACGNAICGNSAIAAVAPVIGADREDVAAAIALTAVLGIGVVLLLPLLIPMLGYSHYQYGVLAGLTVYAVPQVLAAAFAVSPLSGQVATAVKLARVLMLGPVVTFFAIRAHRASASTLSIRKLVPWFVVGFIILAALRSTGVIPESAGQVAKTIAGWLTIAAMAALGLSVDVRSVRRVGSRVTTAVAGSLVALILLAVVLIKLLGIQ